MFSQTSNLFKIQNSNDNKTAVESEDKEMPVSLQILEFTNKKREHDND